jgi:uncharacterized protein YmfQ (DUF2313 family)
MDAAAYARALKALLPPGRLWKKDLDSVLSKLFLAIGDEFARIDERVHELLDEHDPRTTLELLEEWEDMLGLPDECLEETPETINERRAAIVSKYTAQGGQSADYYVQLAAALGYTVTISEYVVARSGRLRSGDRIYGTAWAFAWLVTIDGYEAETNTIFRSGTGRAGDRLRGYDELDIECIFERVAPAHTVVLFNYSGA